MTCDYCIQPARFEDSVPDARVPGTHPSECGYRRVFLCVAHAMERRRVATARVKPLVMFCRRCRAEGDWDHWDTNPRQGTLRCGACARQGCDIIPEDKPDGPAAT